ncbi:MAG: LptF/LptG family permease [Candidatus Krumholzibacteria bacterium]|nr:LptF/LptG family permease [Candidatus Krumholzibacteria bacterium]
MYLIYKHLLATAAGPFFFGWFVITFLLMIDVLFRYVDLFVSKGVPFLMATEVLVLSLGHTFALSVPMAVLIAILMSVGQLAADHEITAMKASGISLWTVLRPLLFGAGVIALGLTAYNHFVFPESNHKLANLLYDINRKKPMLEIRAQQFTDMSDRTTIYVSKKDDVTGRIEDVTIIEKENPGDLSPRVTIAAWGRIAPDHETDSVLIELHDGEIHERPDKKSPDKYQVTRFGQHNLYVENVERDFHDSDRQTRGDREMNLKDLWTTAGKEQERQDKVLDNVGGLAETMLKWQWKLLQPEHRTEILGNNPAPPEDPERKTFLEGKFRATRLKVDRVVEQSRYQEKIRDSYQTRENRYLVEFHKKFAIPFACIVFALIGVPMAVTSSRSGKGISVSLALGVYLVYYLFLVGGEKFSDRGRLDPFLAMWSANIFLLVVGIPLFFKAVRESTLLSITLKPRVADKTVSVGGEPD